MHIAQNSFQVHIVFCRKHGFSISFHIGNTFALSRKDTAIFSVSPLRLKRTVALHIATQSYPATDSTSSTDQPRGISGTADRHIPSYLYIIIVYQVHGISVYLYTHYVVYPFLFPPRAMFLQICPRMADLCILIHRLFS